MTKHPGLAAILRQIERPSDRSPLFHWMVEHHDELAAAANGTRMVWADLCASFAAMKLTCRTGQPATPAVARMTWYRARKLVAQRQAVARKQALTDPAPRSLMPSASPQARTPIETTRPAAIPLPEMGADISGSPRKLVSSEEVQAKLDRLRRVMAERSGR